MKLKLSHLNDHYTIDFNEEITAGSLLASFIKFIGLETPLLNHYNNPVALQMWSTNYCLVLDESIQSQTRSINFDFPISVSYTMYINADDFNQSIIKYMEEDQDDKLIISKVDNKYSNFRDGLKLGASHYINNIQNRNLEPFINDAYKENNFEKLLTDFDENGLFTRHILKSTFFMDDKSCDEEPLGAISDIARLTFNTNDCAFFITFLFQNRNSGDISKFTMDQNGKTDLEPPQINELYSQCYAPNYSIKLVSEDIEVEGEVEFLRYSLNERLALFNELLEKLGRPDKWFVLSNGSCVLTTEHLHKTLIESNILPPDFNYFNPWEY